MARKLMTFYFVIVNSPGLKKRVLKKKCGQNWREKKISYYKSTEMERKMLNKYFWPSPLKNDVCSINNPFTSINFVKLYKVFTKQNLSRIYFDILITQTCVIYSFRGVYLFTSLILLKHILQKCCVISVRSVANRNRWFINGRINTSKRFILNLK